MHHTTGWLIFNFLIVLIGNIIFLSEHLYLSISYCCLPFTSGTLMHSNLVHLLLTINQQQGHESNKLDFCSLLTTSTLVPITLLEQIHTSDSERTRIEHIRKGHLRHGHQQIAHTSQRDHKPTTHKWIYNPHTSTEILFEILLKD